MKKNLKLGLSVVSLASLLALAACGGGGGGGDETPAGTPATTPPPTPTITVQGSAQTVAADPLAVVFVPQTETSTRSVLQSIASNAFPAQFQKAPNDGAYTQLGIDANSLITLNGGTIADVAGNGDFAIGRWTSGSNSIGSISANQGAHYAVGKPLVIQRVLGPSQTLSCSLLASTSPTAVSGNFAPGKLNSATAVIDLNGPSLQLFSLDLQIGADAHATASATLTALNGVLQSQGFMRHIETLGTSQAAPLLAIGYAIPTPSSGDVAGVVVLQCK
ncbi:Autotransporter adhesin (plasmid) [Cupriavidus necator H850]|uniref:hypothetical protein n=1 Tax=Cupriavidus necator TaxID=106590 RepID=UPI00129EF782|nr:hypothetical protein [Cupriavidus necator]KAI3611791.1 Autotransporter adhesin [Cupriavidus necator H850]